MKFLLSYRFTGEDPVELKENVSKICSTVEEIGHEIFCSYWKADFFNENNYSHKQIMDFTLEKLDNSDACLVFINSNEQSEGMIMEVGYALAKGKKIILVIREGVKTNFIEEMSDKIIKFDNLEELNFKLKEGLSENA